MNRGLMIVCGGILAAAFLLAFTGPVLAQAVWVEGKVTERYSTGQVHHIQLDGKKHYMLMKDCRIDMRFRGSPRGFIEKPVDFGYIRVGQRITIKAEDNRAYQILILE
jgi:hypothetical protein